MNFLEIMGHKPTNKLKIVSGNLKYVPAFLHSDESTTIELNEAVYSYFPYDIVRIGQTFGFSDTARYSNTNNCTQLSINVDYDKGVVKAVLSKYEENIAFGSALFEVVDPSDEIETHKDKLVESVKYALDILGDSLVERIENCECLAIA